MPPKKETVEPSNFWPIIIAVLLVICIILILVLIYIYYNNKKVIVVENDRHKELNQTSSNHRTTQNIVQEHPKIVAEIPVYPKKLPTYENTSYQQIGILTSDQSDKEPIVLPLFSRRINNRKDRWNYYTATDKNNMMRLPITFDNMNCDDDVGCREIYNGDTLSIEIYEGRTFVATIYKLDAPRYFADDY